jgi:hypothetical protein
MRTKRKFLAGVALSAVAILIAGNVGAAATPSSGQPLKIGVIGTGKIGSALATLWARAGHQLVISSRHPDELQDLAQSLGNRVRVGTPQEAAAFGDVVLISVPYGALPEVGRDLGRALAGKIVLDTGNPYPGRDGAMAEEARRKGTGVASSEYLPGVRLVRAFNAISYRDLQNQAHRTGEPVAIPIAADDADALAVAQRLVRDAGFEPVVVGSLARAREFDVGSPVYVKPLTAPELRQQLGLQSAPPK